MDETKRYSGKKYGGELQTGGQDQRGGMMARPLQRRCIEKTAAIIFAFIALLAATSEASPWEPVQITSDGIQIFKKETGSSGLIAFRGVGDVDASIPVVASVIFDTGRRLEWIKSLAESRILGWEGNDRYIEYDHIEMPLFFSDRDFVSEVLMLFDASKKEVVFRYRSSTDASAPHTGYLRGEVINMTFVLRSLENGTRTRVDAEFLCDPKGWIPNWLVNYFLQDWPETTFRSLRKETLRSDISIDRRIADLMKPGAMR